MWSSPTVYPGRLDAGLLRRSPSRPTTALWRRQAADAPRPGVTASSHKDLLCSWHDPGWAAVQIMGACSRAPIIDERPRFRRIFFLLLKPQGYCTAGGLLHSLVPFQDT